MSEYHKIHSLFKRDNHGKLLEGQWTLPEFEYLKDCPWHLTEKIDGTNIRVTIKNAAVHFAGRTEAAQLPAHLVNRLRELFDQNEGARSLDNCVLYGEGYGAKIQKAGSLYLPDSVDFILFDVRIGDWWLDRASVEQIAARIGVNCVPNLGVEDLHGALEMVTDGLVSRLADCPAEGIVARPLVELRRKNGERIIVKIKARDFE